MLVVTGKILMVGDREIDDVPHVVIDMGGSRVVLEHIDRVDVAAVACYLDEVVTLTYGGGVDDRVHIYIIQPLTPAQSA